MNIHNVSSTSLLPYPLQSADPPDTGRAPQRVENDESKAPEPSITTDIGPTAAPDDAPDTARAHGVIRKLEAGHFRGVADVRLRINFFDQLSADATQAAATVAQDQARELSDTVNTQIDDLLTTRSLDAQAEASLGELREGFDTAVDTAVTDFAEHGDSAILEQQLQSAFDDLLTQLGSLFPPPPEQSPDQTSDLPDPTTAQTTPGTMNASAPAPTGTESGPALEPSLEPESPPPPPAEADPFAPLLAAFTDALDQFLTAVSTTSQLPDPSPPNGNGGAYDKFLAIYNDLRGTQVNELG